MRLILFPHLNLSQVWAKNIPALFGPFTIFLPWFMERPAFLEDERHAETAGIVYPPAQMKPRKDFRSLLSEYRNWMANQQDRGLREILKADPEEVLTETHTWDIRRRLRRVDESQRGSEQDRALRAHLILHLAREAWDQHQEANDILKDLKKKKSPLEGGLEEVSEGKGLFEDLPQLEPDPFLDEEHLGPILAAWFHLFGGYLHDNDLFMTTSRHVMDYVLEHWRLLPGAEKDPSDPVLRFNAPDLSRYGMEELGEIKKGYCNSTAFSEMNRLIRDLTTSPNDHLAALERALREVEASLPWDLSQETLRITLKSLKAPSHVEDIKRDGIIRFLLRKTIILMVQETGDE